MFDFETGKSVARASRGAWFIGASKLGQAHQHGWKGVAEDGEVQSGI